MKTKKLILCLIKILFILFLWEFLVWLKLFSPLIFPPFSEIATAIYNDIVNGELPKSMVHSLVIIAKGLGIGAGIAIVLSTFSTFSIIFRKSIDELISIAHPLPGIALLPLVILFIGTGSNAIIFIIVHSVLWPMTLNINTGYKSIPKIYKDVGENLGLSKYKMIFEVFVPSSLPYLISGLKIGWARSWRALISAEMIFGTVGGKGGIGWYIFKQRVFMDAPSMYGGIITIILIGIFVEKVLFNNLEKNTIEKWKMAN